MKFILPILLFYLFIGTNITSAQESHVKLEEQFKGSSVLPIIHYGFSLYDMDNDVHLFDIKGNQHFTPASNTKTYTLFSTLKHIGDSIPGIQYVERGDSLIFWGTGDPTFLHPKLDSHLVYNFLKASKKKLFYVAQSSAEPAYRNGWSIEDYQEYYQPDIATFPIYGNVVRIDVDSINGVKAIPSYFNQSFSKKEQIQPSFSVVRKQNANIFEYPSNVISRSLSIEKPFIWSDSLFVSLLQDTLGVSINTLYEYNKPIDLKVIYSVPRNVVLREMMLPSDNFLAEHLTMLISSAKYNGFYTDSLRKDMQKEYFSHFRDSIILRDGSGLSTYNKITPNNMVDLLLAIEKEVPDDGKRYLFFPAGGIDGTLRTAYELDNDEPFIWAKTGTVNSVHCQSGYIVTRQGRRLAFSFLNNNYMVPTSAIRKEMVRIMTFIRQNY